jgi:hypothetical protein
MNKQGAGENFYAACSKIFAKCGADCPTGITEGFGCRARALPTDELSLETKESAIFSENFPGFVAFDLLPTTCVAIELKNLDNLLTSILRNSP